MIYREQLTMPDRAADNLDDLLRTKDPAELKRRLFGYLDEHSESEVELTALAEALHAFEPTAFSDISTIRQKYESMVGGRKASKIPFSGYLGEYLRQAVKTVAARAIDSRNIREEKTAQEKSAQEAEQARREARTREQAEAVEIEKLVPIIRREILAEMESRTPHVNHLPEHQEVISHINKKNKIEHGFGGKRMVEGEKLTREREYLLGALMDKYGLFGPDTKMYHTDKYDDIAQQADFAASIKNGPTMLIDLTHNKFDAGEKLYFNQQNPIRILEYPPHTDLANKRGVPIVVGISDADTDGAINQFLKSEAKERLGIKPEMADQKVYQESFGRWIEYILLQLEHQQNYILEHAQEVKDNDLLEDYNDALKIYKEAVDYFKTLKKERYPFVRLNEKRPWDQRMLAISSEVRAYETREGLGEPAPSLPELARAA